jgi:hypothetical protein
MVGDHVPVMGVPGPLAVSPRGGAVAVDPVDELESVFRKFE